MLRTRKISWVKAALKDFKAFPAAAQLECLRALMVAAEGGKADIAKPFKGIKGGIFEIALKHRSDAYRVIYAVQIGTVLWVVDAFQKKSTRGIATAQVDTDRIRQRIKQLRDTYT